MPSPNFLIVGAQKAGTSWLSSNLAKHPDIYIPPQEIHFFDKSHNFRKGTAWYESHFKEAGQEKLVGEKTPEYLWVTDEFPDNHQADIPQSIYEFYPQAKLIIIVRNPVERAISAINHIIRSGRISPLIKIDDLIIGEHKGLLEGHGVLDKGNYYKHLKRFLEYFPLDQMLVLVFEDDLIKNPRETLKQVCGFLGVDPSYNFKGINRKVNRFKRSRFGLLLSYYIPLLRWPTIIMDKCLPLKNSKQYPGKEALAGLYDYFKDENQHLYKLIGRHPAAWDKPFLPDENMAYQKINK